MKVLVMGTGGVGGYFGGLLARAGNEVKFIARGSHLSAIKANGLTIESVVEPTFTLNIDASAAPPLDYTADLIMFCVKNYHTKESAELIRPAVGECTTILPLQNGVDSADILSAFFGAERVIGGLAYIEVSVSAPGVISQRGGARKVIFGELNNGSPERCEIFLNNFREAGIVVEHSTLIKQALWSKLIFISAFAGLNTITGLAAGQLRESPLARDVLKSAISESILVGNAEGAGLPQEALENTLNTLDSFPEHGLTSMYRDRLAGNRLESSELVGSIVRRGEIHGIKTPTMHFIESLISPMADGNAKPNL